MSWDFVFLHSFPEFLNLKSFEDDRLFIFGLSLSLGLSDVFPYLDSDYVPLAGVSQKGCSALPILHLIR